MENRVVMYDCCNLDHITRDVVTASKSNPKLFEITICVWNYIWSWCEVLAVCSGTCSKIVTARAITVAKALGKQWDKEHPIACQGCSKIIVKPATWLEMNAITGQWTTSDKPWPKEHSAGWYPFEQRCVKAALAGKRRKSTVMLRKWIDILKRMESDNV